MGARYGTVLDLLQHFDYGPSDQTRLESTRKPREQKKPSAFTSKSPSSASGHFSIGDTPVTALGFEQVYTAIPVILERPRR